MTSPSRILIVDDFEINVDIMTRRLQRAGYPVLSASSGSQALRVLETEQIHLILLDQRMPEMTGIEVLRLIRAKEQWRRLPVIMISADDDHTTGAEALKSGADDYLTKPVDFKVMLDKIRTHLARANHPGQDGPGHASHP